MNSACRSTEKAGSSAKKQSNQNRPPAEFGMGTHVCGCGRVWFAGPTCLGHIHIHMHIHIHSLLTRQFRGHAVPEAQHLKPSCRSWPNCCSTSPRTELLVASAAILGVYRQIDMGSCDINFTIRASNLAKCLELVLHCYTSSSPHQKFLPLGRAILGSCLSQCHGCWCGGLRCRCGLDLHVSRLMPAAMPLLRHMQRSQSPCLCGKELAQLEADTQKVFSLGGTTRHLQRQGLASA